jgi:fermentation-respiration switch protein FrsA (DUF1100 family)
VKEQMAGLYAGRLAQLGFVTLAFDFRHWGASGARPRHSRGPFWPKSSEMPHALTAR